MIVAHEEEAYAAVQVTRSTRRNGVSPELDPALHDLARELAQKARHGDLSALVGAGLSMNAGLPSWWKLLATAATAFEVGPCDEGEDALAYASRIERKAGPDRFRQAIAGRCCSTRYALGHALLASMPIREFVTLNYDQLLEGAARDAGAPLTVIPHGRVKAKDRWLLKLHGSVDRPKDIVITAQDYAGFDEWRAAFRGVIEAQLITRHMLFVGFGMTDPNVDKVLTTVARAAQGDDGQKGDTVGTVLMFSSTIPDKYAQLYPLRFVCVGPADMTSAERARQLEILLDEVARIAEDGTHHLLDRRFDGLHATEVAVREKVADFLTGLHATHPDSRLRRENHGAPPSAHGWRSPAHPTAQPEMTSCVLVGDLGPNPAPLAEALWSLARHRDLRVRAAFLLTYTRGAHYLDREFLAAGARARPAARRSRRRRPPADALFLHRVHADNGATIDDDWEPAHTLAWNEARWRTAHAALDAAGTTLSSSPSLGGRRRSMSARSTPSSSSSRPPAGPPARRARERCPRRGWERLHLP